MLFAARRRKDRVRFIARAFLTHSFHPFFILEVDLNRKTAGMKLKFFLLVYHLSVFGRELCHLLAVLNFVRAQDKGPLRATYGSE